MPSFFDVIAPPTNVIIELAYTGDVRLAPDGGIGAMFVLQNDLLRDDGLETAVLISLFTDRRSNENDALPDNTEDRRGWWGDATLDKAIGSRLWLLSRSKVEAKTASAFEDYAKESLAWMVEDGVAESVDVQVIRASMTEYTVDVQIKKPRGAEDVAFRWFYNWRAQELRRIA